MAGCGFIASTTCLITGISVGLIVHIEYGTTQMPKQAFSLAADQTLDT